VPVRVAVSEELSDATYLPESCEPSDEIAPEILRVSFDCCPVSEILFDPSRVPETAIGIVGSKDWLPVICTCPVTDVFDCDRLAARKVSCFVLVIAVALQVPDDVIPGVAGGAGGVVGPPPEVGETPPHPSSENGIAAAISKRLSDSPTEFLLRTGSDLLPGSKKPFAFRLQENSETRRPKLLDSLDLMNPPQSEICKQHHSLEDSTSLPTLISPKWEVSLRAGASQGSSLSNLRTSRVAGQRWVFAE
jgi:hypothetical protein